MPKLTEDEKTQFIEGGATKCPFCTRDGMDELARLSRVYPHRMTNGLREVNVLFRCEGCFALLEVMYKLDTVLMGVRKD